jgi:predicted dithiol-disulfide oxidoreductase (DUF899 family)
LPHNWIAHTCSRHQPAWAGNPKFSRVLAAPFPWLVARLKLLKAEKELTRRSDELVRRRQQLPWVQIDKQYRFETDEGIASLTDLFRGRSQLLVYHFMFGPDYPAGCPSCSAIADGFNGFTLHLANHDVMLWAVSPSRVMNSRRLITRSPRRRARASLAEFQAQGP